jgi:hypothetical protein
MCSVCTVYVYDVRVYSVCILYVFWVCVCMLYVCYVYVYCVCMHVWCNMGVWCVCMFVYVCGVCGMCLYEVCMCICLFCVYVVCVWYLFVWYVYVVCLCLCCVCGMCMCGVCMWCVSYVCIVCCVCFVCVLYVVCVPRTDLSLHPSICRRNQGPSTGGQRVCIKVTNSHGYRESAVSECNVKVCIRLISDFYTKLRNSYKKLTGTNWEKKSMLKTGIKSSPT